MGCATPFLTLTFGIVYSFKLQTTILVQMSRDTVTKSDIEKMFLQYYADGKRDEFFLTDRYNNLKFPRLEKENAKKIKDVAVSLVRAGFLNGQIHQDKGEITVTTKGITIEGLKYLKTFASVR